jgi:methylenetetrahydrofolate reductase (NADPH)
MFGASSGFAVLAEIEPATKPDLSGVRRQIAVLATVADAFLVPDNHLGRATVSSIAVAHEVAYMGGRVVACINGRDRNELGFDRDLLTAAAYGVDHLLLVGGDRPRGEVSGGMKVSSMVRAAKAAGEDSQRFPSFGGFTVGAAAQIGRPLVAWKREADFLLVQVSFEEIDRLVEWRQSINYSGAVLPAVLVLASAAMADRLCQGNFGIDIPSPVRERLLDEPDCGVEVAIDRVNEVRDCGAFDGVHMVAGNRYRQVAQAMLR